MKIAVAGTGYVGLSIATLLAQHNQVMAIDIIPEKVDMVNRRQSPIQDEYIEKYFAEKALNLKATLDAEEAYQGSRFRGDRRSYQLRSAEELLRYIGCRSSHRSGIADQSGCSDGH